MEVIAQVGRDHPVDLKRVVMNPDGSQVHEHLLTIVPVSLRGGTAKICFLGRSDVHIVRQEARKQGRNVRVAKPGEAQQAEQEAEADAEEAATRGRK